MTGLIGGRPRPITRQEQHRESIMNRQEIERALLELGFGWLPEPLAATCHNAATLPALAPASYPPGRISSANLAPSNSPRH
jgi:hypothetical protein